MLKASASTLYICLLIVTVPLLPTNPFGWVIGLAGIGAWLTLGVWVMSLPDP